MSSYIDFSNYSDSEILYMQREKRKEYIILIQSEKIAKQLLNYYGESLYTTNYHYRVNSEYYLLQERVVKKKLLSQNNIDESIIKIPLNSIIIRLEESKKELSRINKNYYLTYAKIIDEIINKVNNWNDEITYVDGILYFTNNDEKTVIDEKTIANLINNENSKQKIKH